jgi:sec-independent protein translocase protein TatA
VSLGPAEILVVLVIALLVFGPTRLPEIGRQVGRAMKEFRKFQSSLKVDIDSVFAEDVSAHQEPAPTLPPKPVEPPPDRAPDRAADPPPPEQHTADDAPGAAPADGADPTPSA